MLRVIGGKFRGRKLKAPKGLTTRPVLARVREALFTVLGDIEGLRVLDLFAGTGAIGIEAVSRGAESVVFVDSGSQQCRIIRDNLTVVGIAAEVIQSEVSRVLKKMGIAGSTFDIVFADPPYEQGLGLQTLRAVCGGSILSASGIIALTVRRTEDLPETICCCRKLLNRCYGDTRLLLYTGSYVQNREVAES